MIAILSDMSGATLVTLLLVLTAFLVVYGRVAERRMLATFQIFFRWWPAVPHYIFFVGTWVHEISHALASLLLGVRLRKVSLFSPKRQLDGGLVLGSVTHDNCGAFRGTLIGLAPTFGCALATLGALILLTPAPAGASAYAPAVGFRLGWLVTHPLDWQTFVFGYIAIACALSGNPSSVDTRRMPAFLAIGAFAALMFWVFGTWIWGFVPAQVYGEFVGPALVGVLTALLFQAGVLFVAHIVSAIVMRAKGYRLA